MTNEKINQDEKNACQIALNARRHFISSKGAGAIISTDPKVLSDAKKALRLISQPVKLT